MLLPVWVKNFVPRQLDESIAWYGSNKSCWQANPNFKKTNTNSLKTTLSWELRLYIYYFIFYSPVSYSYFSAVPRNVQPFPIAVPLNPFRAKKNRQRAAATAKEIVAASPAPLISYLGINTIHKP
jgi:hypothetical protein